MADLINSPHTTTLLPRTKYDLGPDLSFSGDSEIVFYLTPGPLLTTTTIPNHLLFRAPFTSPRIIHSNFPEDYDDIPSSHRRRSFRTSYNYNSNFALLLSLTRSHNLFARRKKSSPERKRRRRNVGRKTWFIPNLPFTFPFRFL